MNRNFVGNLFALTTHHIGSHLMAGIADFQQGIATLELIQETDCPQTLIPEGGAISNSKLSCGLAAQCNYHPEPSGLIEPYRNRTHCVSLRAYR